MKMDKKLIFDIGVCDGKDSLFYLEKGFRVVGIEANPKLVESLRNNFKKYIETGDFVLIDKALSNKSNQKIKFYINDDKIDWGTTLDTWNRSMNNNFREVEVETITLNEIIGSYGIPYFMKIDIEGSDIIALDSLIMLNKKPLYLSIELLTPNNYNDNNICQENRHLEILEKLRQLGYEKFVISNQARKKTLEYSQEGKNINQNFGGHHSGLFGKDIFNVESEIPYETIVEKYNQYFKTKNNNDLFNHISWYDIHCTYD